MKIVADHLDAAMKFEQMAVAEKDPKLKAEFERSSRRLSQARGRAKPKNTGSK
jgi:hypothetical protein